MLEKGIRVVTELGLGTIISVDKCHEWVRSPRGALTEIWSECYGYLYEVELDNKSKDLWIFSPEKNPCFWEVDLVVIIRTKEEREQAIRQLAETAYPINILDIDMLKPAIELYDNNIGRVD